MHFIIENNLRINIVVIVDNFLLQSPTYLKKNLDANTYTKNLVAIKKYFHLIGNMKTRITIDKIKSGKILDNINLF